MFNHTRFVRHTGLKGRLLGLDHVTPVSLKRDLPKAMLDVYPNHHPRNVEFRPSDGSSSAVEVATCTIKGVLRVWKLKSGTPAATLNCERTWTADGQLGRNDVSKTVVESMLWHPDGTHLAVCFQSTAAEDEDAQVALVRYPSVHDEPVHKLRGTGVRHISAATWVPHKDGAKFVTAGKDGHRVVAWGNLASLTAPKSKRRDAAQEVKVELVHAKHSAIVHCLCAYGDWLVSGGNDGKIIVTRMDASDIHGVYQTAKVKVTEKKSVHLKVTHLELHPTRDVLLACCITTGVRRLLLLTVDQRTMNPSLTHVLDFDREWRGKPGSVTANIKPKFSSDGSHISCGSTQGVLHVWHVDQLLPCVR